MTILSKISTESLQGQKKLAVLIDPDKHALSSLQKLIKSAKKGAVDYFFFGGSLLTRSLQDEFIHEIKTTCTIPVILFPGNHFQIHHEADGILFLSLISGRNAELLIGKHVIAAPYLMASKLEVIPTGYLLIDGGKATTVVYMSHTIPIPAEKSEIAVSTALAGELLGLRAIYLDAGSGALNPVPGVMITQVKKNISLPLIVGGGIRNPQQGAAAAKAGADVVVVGNILEEDPSLMIPIARAIHQESRSVSR